MTLRSAPLIFLLLVLTGCVTTGKVNPMDTRQGQEQARDAYIQLGLGYLQQGDTERAKVPLKKALELDSRNADASAALALVFQAEGETALAEEQFGKALSARPGDARILNNYGGFLYAQKRYKDAYEKFQQASADALYPERSRVFENMGITALMLGNKDEARQLLDRALRLNRQQPRALLEMAQLSYEAQQYVPARDYYERFNQLSEQSARSLLLGTRLAKLFDDKNRAASYGLQLKRLYPGTPEYQQYLSEQR